MDETTAAWTDEKMAVHSVAHSAVCWVASRDVMSDDEKEEMMAGYLVVNSAVC